MSSAVASSEKLKILCIHGYRQNAQIFRERTGALRKIIKKYTELVFISAPNKVQAAEGEEDLDQRGWWFSTTDSTFKASQPSDVDSGFEESLTAVAEAFKELGPFDGILAFSQGAAFAAILCALQSQGESSEELLQVFADPKVLNHPGGHFVPASSPQKKVYLEFLEYWFTKKQEENCTLK